MTVHRPLFWHQGLFLQPQHFQLHDLSGEVAHEPYRRFLEPHFWGAGSLEIQKAALGTRSFGLVQGSFLFPDGTWIEYPGNALIEARPFEEAWVEGGKSFPVYVGIRKWNDSGENVTVLSRLAGMWRLRPVSSRPPIPRRSAISTPAVPWGR